MASLDGTYDGSIYAPPEALIYDSTDMLWVGNALAINRLSSIGVLDTLDAYEGLPFANITSLWIHDKEAWIGTEMGIVYRNKEGKWRYYYGPRYHAGSSVVSLTGIPGTGNTYVTVFVATDAGMSMLQLKDFTLDEKAALFQVNKKTVCSDL